MGRHTAGRKAQEGQASPVPEDQPETATRPLPVTAYAVPETTGGGVPWPVPPSETTSRMFAALSPESLESESLASSDRLASSSLLAPSDRLVASGPARSERVKADRVRADRARADGPGSRGPAGPDRDDRSEQPRRLRRLALVSGLSVLLAVGVTTGGARLLAGRTSLTLEQPTTACPTSENCAALGLPYGASDSGPALGGTPTPGAPTGDPAGNGQEDSGKSGARESDTEQNNTGRDGTGHNKDGSAAARATSDPTSAPTPGRTSVSADPDRDHTSARTRTRGPSSTTAPRASRTSPRVGDAAAVTAPGEDTGDDTANDPGDNSGNTVPGETALDDTGNGEDGAGAGQTDSALAADAPAVRVRFTVTRRDESGYTARLTVRNEGPALPEWAIRLVVGGRVTAVDGADWRQREDILTLSSQTALREGDTLTLTIHADGAAVAPADCVLAEGRCEATSPRPSRHRG
ncbi:hypothetical protein GCM10010116_09220 [Microbispora rosea subsp. aerata]|nr:hypothetical protein [Microbispora rosea]GGO04622.1 hypothetical protein GCM10010116_09220 [Microbispora rosea subsp. aerata]GIH56300.1 hypothetical protein Mro02_32140 [Microbispora rosea subsp. aerata]GLJ82260.1 hypothetical protein GCM10017588_09850 [Microbispora rosea subsp. aerata]